jgi:streptogramin lyase
MANCTGCGSAVTNPLYPIPTAASYPAGIAAGPDGALWFTEEYANKIGRITTTGAFTEFTIPTANSIPIGITTGPDGALWFTLTVPGGGKIGRITTAGAITEYSMPTANSGPGGITAGPDGALWFTLSVPGGGKIGRITTAGTISEYPIPTANILFGGITTGPDGALWFTEAQSGNIGRINTTGAISEYAIPTTVASSPGGITAGPDGALWFTEPTLNKIGRATINASGTPLQQTCTNATLKGSYFYLLSGFIVSGNQALPYAELGKLVADGQGGVSGQSTASVNGVFGTYSLTGTYAVQGSCSGTITLTVNSSSIVTANFEVVNGGQSAILAISNPGEVIVGRAYQVSAGSTVCGNGSLAESYGYLLSGVSGNLVFSEEGQVVSDGNGNLTLSSVVNINGTVTQVPGTGTYTLASDCSGTATVTSQLGTNKYIFAVVEDGQNGVFLATDPGTTVAGTAQPQALPSISAPPSPFASGGESLSASGSSGSINLTFPPGFAWTAMSSASWLTLNGSTSGSGSGTLTYQVAANPGADRSATITVAGYTFTIEQEAGSIPGLSFIGSMPHLAAEENWTTMFTLVNKSTASATARLSLFGDPSGTLTLPLTFPQQPTAPNPLLAASLDQAISANASLIIDTGGPQTPPVLVGSAQLAATGAVDGFAIFHHVLTGQETVVPMETRNASSYLLAFDNTSGVVLGVAVENVSAQAGNVGVIIRDDTGTQIGTGTIPMSASGHTSFVLSSQYPVTANKRGTIEFDRPSGGQISAMGMRFTPPNNALTTIPALANIGTNGGSIAHIATGNGWQTTFVLVNTGASAVPVNLNFFADVTGAPLSLPLSFPQSGSGTTTVASSVNQTLAAGATLLVQSAAPLSNPTPTIGSAQLTTTGNVSGFVIFRYNPNGQEAVVPLESRNANGYILAFDNTNGTATGVAINSVSAQAVNVPVVIRDDTGTQIATDTLTLASNGSLAFTLVTDKYPATANIRGTIEFDTPPGGQISALAFRIPVAHTFTTLPALVK